MIIRGGENVPVVEIENVLYRHPAVRQVAIVAMPDARLERACAFVVAREGGVAQIHGHAGIPTEIRRRAFVLAGAARIG